VAGNKKQQDSRQKLHEPRQAEVQRALRDFVDLPADGHRLHFHREDHARAGGLKQ
jgi:hypothetical protein